MYPGAGTFVLIRPAQTFYERIKILCHNICVLIQSVYELGIEPIFGSETLGTKGPVVPKMAWE